MICHKPLTHEKLLTDLNNSSLPGTIVKWFSCYSKGLPDRQQYVKLGQHSSTPQPWYSVTGSSAHCCSQHTSPSRQLHQVTRHLVSPVFQRHAAVCRHECQRRLWTAWLNDQQPSC